MEWRQVKVAFRAADRERAVELISAVFYGMGVSGLEIHDPEPDPAADWAEEPAEIPHEDAVVAYFPENAAFYERISELEAALDRLRREAGLEIWMGLRTVDEEDWAEAWKTFFWPEKVGNHVVVKPTWREYTPASPDEVIIEIDPGMAFGTGTHPTTALCIRMIEVYLRPGMTVLDVGTGSGILLAVAARFGAKALRGVDMDPVAVEIAIQNLRLNGANPGEFRVTSGHLAAQVSGRYDFVIANILTDVVLVLLDDLDRLMAPGGMAVLSGITVENRSRVVKKAESIGFSVVDDQEEDGWTALCVRRSGEASRGR
jgi:ribosomal protein L11 methyltransferase